MIVFFYFTQPVNSNRIEHNRQLQYKFEASSKDDEIMSFDKIYFSTPSDFQKHVKSIEQAYKEKSKDIIRIMKPDYVVENSDFPKNIGYKESLEKELEEFKGKKTVRLGILNAMSNALGDHLIGMQAYDVWQERVREILKDSEVKIDFFQLSPIHMGPITKRWHEKFNEIYTLPNRFSKLVELDAYIDLGALILNEDFDKKPMIDFYFQALSIDSNSVSEESKRNKFKPSDKSLSKIKRVFGEIRKKKRPILLFHRQSTNDIRTMREPEARQLIKKIMDETDYFVVSATPTEFFNDRYLDISDFSSNLEDFIAIISESDAMVTVDTCSYHFGDAFNIPTVALFTSIDPELRTKYYPYVESVMLEKSGGMIYGKHHTSTNPEIKLQQIRYTDELWRSLNASEVVEKLQRMEEKLKA